MSSSDIKKQHSSPVKKKIRNDDGDYDVDDVDAFLSPSLKSSLNFGGDKSSGTNLSNCDSDGSDGSWSGSDSSEEDDSDIEYQPSSTDTKNDMSAEDFLCSLSVEVDNVHLEENDDNTNNTRRIDMNNNDYTITTNQEKAGFICEQFYVGALFMTAFTGLVDAEPTTPIRKALQDDTISTIQLACDVITDPLKYKGKGKQYEDLFNKERESMGTTIQNNTQKKYHNMINFGHKFSITLMLLMYLHYAPMGCFVELLNCMPELQCCIMTMQQSIIRYLWAEYHGEKTTKTFNEFIKSVDMAPFTLIKGTASDIKDQYEELTEMLKFASIYELFIITFNMMVKHAILYKIQNPSSVLQVHVPSSWTAKYVFGYGKGHEKYCPTDLCSSIIKLSIGLHPQGWIMGMNKSETLLPDTARKALSKNLVECYIGIIEMCVPETERRKDFTTNITTEFGKAWAESRIAVGAMNHLAMLFANAFSTEDEWDSTSEALPVEAVNAFNTLKGVNEGDAAFIEKLKRFRINANLQIVASAILDGSVPPADVSVFDPFRLEFFEQNQTFSKLTAPVQDLFNNLMGKYAKEKHTEHRTRKVLLHKLKRVANHGKHTLLANELVTELAGIDINNAEAIARLYDQIDDVLGRDYNEENDEGESVPANCLKLRWLSLLKRHEGKQNMDLVKKYRNKKSEEGMTVSTNVLGGIEDIMSSNTDHETTKSDEVEVLGDDDDLL